MFTDRRHFPRFRSVRELPGTCGDCRAPAHSRSGGNAGEEERFGCSLGGDKEKAEDQMVVGMKVRGSSKPCGKQGRS